jgi:two-component system chemotaxis response regulator CheB
LSFGGHDTLKKRKRKGKIRVLVVDDSAFMRKLLTEAIESDPDCKVIGTAGDGIEALKSVKKLKPDVITLDIELPEIDGLTILIYIMEDFPTPVVMVTGFSSYMGDKTISALQHGAVGFVRKPSGSLSTGSVPHDVERMREDLISHIKMAAEVPLEKLISSNGKNRTEPPKKITPKTTDKIVVIASSSGGPRALGQLIPNLPADLRAGVLMVQHMPPEFIPPLANRLNLESLLRVEVAKDRKQINQGECLLIPSHCHCTLKQGKNKETSIGITSASDEDSRYFTLANEVMISLAPIYGRNATGVVLTGMGDDGTEGLRAISEHGGRTIAEDESTCLVNGMPGSAIRAGVVDKVVPLDKIAREIVKAVNR